MLGVVQNVLVVREIDTEDGICKTYERVELKKFVTIVGEATSQLTDLVVRK